MRQVVQQSPWSVLNLSPILVKLVFFGVGSGKVSMVELLVVVVGGDFGAHLSGLLLWAGLWATLGCHLWFRLLQSWTPQRTEIPSSFWVHHQTTLQMFFMSRTFQAIACGCRPCFAACQYWEVCASIVFVTLLHLQLLFDYYWLNKPSSITWFSNIVLRAPGYLETLSSFSYSFLTWGIWNRTQYLSMQLLQHWVSFDCPPLGFPFTVRADFAQWNTSQSVWSPGRSRKAVVQSVCSQAAMT